MWGFYISMSHCFSALSCSALLIVVLFHKTKKKREKEIVTTILQLQQLYFLCTFEGWKNTVRGEKKPTKLFLIPSLEVWKLNHMVWSTTFSLIGGRVLYSIQTMCIGTPNSDKIYGHPKM